MPEPEHLAVPSDQDSTTFTTTTTTTTTTNNTSHEPPSTKCRGTLKTMATPPSATAVAAGVPGPPSPAVSAAPPGIKPPNPDDAHHHPTTPPPHNHHHQHHYLASNDDISPSSTKFDITAVAILRAVAIVFAITHLIMECTGRHRYNFAASLFVTIASLQLLWLVYALVAELGLPSGRGRGRGERRKGLIVDLGFVRCIFGRRGYEDEDGDGDAVLRLVPGGGDGKKKKRVGGGRVPLLCTAVDVVFATVTFTIAVLSLRNSGRMWYWERHVGIGVMGLVVAAHMIAIAISQHLSIMRRSKIRFLCEDEGDGDEEEDDDLGSPKYRIRLPQSPGYGRAAMSVAA